MIHPISSIKSKTGHLPKMDAETAPNKVAEVRARSHWENVWSPITAGPYLVPVSRWVE